MTTLYADTIFSNGYIYSADQANHVYEAIAIKDGFIMAVGSNEQILPLANDKTEQIDLHGRMAMPGIIDSHMHPMWGAKQLDAMSLGYQDLTVDEILEVIAKRLRSEANTPADQWLVVRAWLCIGGTQVDKSDLDKLDTQRPIMLFSNDCHYLALNSRGLTRLGINSKTPLPDDGVIVLDDHHVPIGLIEDAPAMTYFDRATALALEEGIRVFTSAQKALNKEGVTTIMDARSLDEEFSVFKAMQDRGILNLRILGAVEIKPRDLATPETLNAAIERIKTFADTYSTPRWDSPKPALSVHQAKFFIDGMIPSKTAYLLEPYQQNGSDKEHPQLTHAKQGGQPFFSQQQLEAAFIKCADNDLDPHMHTIADGSIEICLNAIEKMRAHSGNKDIRPALAHDDITAAHQYRRFKALRVTANLSFQWAGYTQKIIDLHRELIGDALIAHNFETHGRFFDAGVNVAYNSDWPIDPLNEWFNFQVGLTRRIDESQPRLNSDRDLTVIEVLRAATINAAYALKKEDTIGSLEKGKFADLIILDKNAFEIDKRLFSTINVVMTIVGGKVVYQA